MMKNIAKLMVMASVIFSTTTLFAAGWSLNSNESQLNFISIKKGTIAEVHQFQSLQGEFDEQGKVSIMIDLASVDTKIAIRDSRMQEHLFEVAKYPTATLSAEIDTEIIYAIAEGASKQLTVDAILELHGNSKALEMDVIITRLVRAKLSVASVKPVIINAGDFSLVAGIDKLMALAKLPSISHDIPVTFYLTFNLKKY